MNLFSYTQLKLIKKTTITKLIGICIFSIITSQNVHAFDLNINLANNINSLKQLNYQNLVNSKFINNLPNLLTTKPKISVSTADGNTFSYLTFYSKKNQKLNATFEEGAYVIKYTRSW